MRRIWGPLAMAIAAGGIVLGGVVVTQDGGSSPEGTANVWVDTSGGTCTYAASPAAYSDAAACATIDAAWDAMSNGDTARIAAGTYTTSQCVTGDKTADTFVIGAGDDPGDVVIENDDTYCFAVFSGSSAVGVAADHFWLQNVTLDSLNTTTVGSAARIWNYGECTPTCNGENVTFIDVESKGYWPAFKVEADGFTWIGGTRGEVGVINSPPVCEPGGLNVTGQPLDLSGNNAHIEGIWFEAVDITSDPPDCDPHVENIRLQGAIDNIVIKNSFFVGNTDTGSGHMFTGGALPHATDVHIINNYFGPVIGTYWCQCTAGAAGEGGGWVLAYNTFTQDGGPHADYIGNLAAKSVFDSIGGGCGSGTHIKNVWVGGSGSCGSDTFVASGTIGVDSAGHLEAGSPGIDAAETPGASDYCTDAAYANSVDRDGDTRPVNTVCDAGADERP